MGMLRWPCYAPKVIATSCSLFAAISSPFKVAATMPKMDDDALFSSLRDKLFTAVVGDVLDKMGWRRQFLPQAIGPLRPDMKVVGRAS